MVNKSRRSIKTSPKTVKKYLYMSPPFLVYNRSLYISASVKVWLSNIETGCLIHSFTKAFSESCGRSPCHRVLSNSNRSNRKQTNKQTMRLNLRKGFFGRLFNVHPLPRQERLWRIRKNFNFLIGCSVTACIVLPLKSCGNIIPVPQSLSWRPTTGQRA